MKELQNKKVFITGGAQGIGKEIAQAFAAEGCELLLSDINQEALEKTSEELRESGTSCHSYVLDVTDTDAIARVRDQVEKDVGTVDVLVNNAGVVFGGPFLDVPLEKHIATYRINMEGLMVVTYYFLPLLIRCGTAHLVNVASASGFIALPNAATYASTKWAVVGFSESIRVELKRQGHTDVKVTTVCPSYVDTGMFEGVQTPKATPMLDPQELGREVIKAVKKDRAFVIKPFMAKVASVGRAALPVSVWDLMTDLFGSSSSMETWRGH